MRAAILPSVLDVSNSINGIFHICLLSINLSISDFLDNLCRDSTDHYIGRYIFSYDSSSSHDRIVADGHALQDSRV